MTKILLSCFILALSQQSFGQDYVRGFSLNELGDYKYDARFGGPKTEAQKVVDKLYDLGVRQVNLSPRAIMKDPRGSQVLLKTVVDSDRPGWAIADERNRYLRMMRYIKEKGMKVGIRPIFFVVDDNGNTPFKEIQPDGTTKVWWHGNIQPKDPNAWFASFRSYLNHYAAIAAIGAADEFTIGAELYSMTVGIEDQWLEHPHGFPQQWLEIVKAIKRTLPNATVMYDINFTDAVAGSGGINRMGGELERWRYRLVDLADENNPYWTALSSFWRELDVVGVDMYRSLATDSTEIPENYTQLVSLLSGTSDRYATEMDNALFQIQWAVNAEKTVILKEIGFRSTRNGFIRPFEYAQHEGGPLNIEHQSAAYEAIFQSFWRAGWQWFGGIVFWDAYIDPSKHGNEDRGFSILGKEQSEDVVKTYFHEGL